MLFAGIDVSTQSSKIVIIDAQKNDLLYVDSINYDNDLPEFNTFNGVIKDQPEGVSESDPLMWLNALDILLERLKKSQIPQNKIKCLSVSGQQHGLVSLDIDEKLSRPKSKLWNDFSTREECDLLTAEIGGLDAMIFEVGNAQLTGYTASKIFHMARHEAQNFKKTESLLLVHNYINWYLTGGVMAMEPGDASGMALWHPGKRKWSKKVARLIDPNLFNKFPAISPSDKTIGFVSEKLVNEFGFDPQCQVDAGSGDNMYGAVGTGNIEPGIVTISLGTSGTVYTYMEEPFIDPLGEIAAFCDSTGHYLPLLCVTNLANGYNDIIRQYNLSHAEFNEIINKTPAGNDGRLLIPWYEGERTPNVPNATPIYMGFSLKDFNVEFLSRAVLEGHVQGLYDGFKRLPVEPAEIRLTGGLSKSEAWGQAIADIFNTETVPVEGEGAALGAALHAAWVWGKENKVNKSLKEISTPFIRLNEKQRKKPVPAHRKVYDLQASIYSKLSSAIRSDEKAIFNLRHDLIKD